MPQASLDALVVAYRDLANWLMAHASELESGDRKMTAHIRGRDMDLTANYVAEYRHKANILMAILDALERRRSQEHRAEVSNSLRFFWPWEPLGINDPPIKGVTKLSGTAQLPVR